MQTNNVELSNTATGKPERRYDIGWLRVLVMLLSSFSTVPDFSEIVTGKCYYIRTRGLQKGSQ